MCRRADDWWMPARSAGLRVPAVRALGPLASAEPDVAQPHPTRPQDPAGEVVQAHIARNVRALILQDVRVRRDLPDAVHQMRVAARRIRSGLKVFTPLVDPDWSEHLRSELQWVASTLGEIRDREVLEVRLLRDLGHFSRPESVDVGPAAALVRKTLDADMATGRADVDAALSSARYVALLDALVAAAAQPHLTEAATVPAEEVLPPLVTKAWKRLARDVAASSSTDRTTTGMRPALPPRRCGMRPRRWSPCSETGEAAGRTGRTGHRAAG